MEVGIILVYCKMAGSELLGNCWEENRQVTGKVVTRRQSYSRSPVCVLCMVSDALPILVEIDILPSNTFCLIVRFGCTSLRETADILANVPLKQASKHLYLPLVKTHNNANIHKATDGLHYKCSQAKSTK